jgi:hypothetical protein
MPVGIDWNKEYDFLFVSLPKTTVCGQEQSEDFGLCFAKIPSGQ